jgi:hypothetical protein
MEIESTAVRSEFIPLFSMGFRKYKNTKSASHWNLMVQGCAAVQTSKPSNEKDTLDHICLKGSKAELPS